MDILSKEAREILYRRVMDILRKFRPMLAAKVGDLDKLDYPMLVSPKIDGIRCLTLPKLIKVNGGPDIRVVSRTLREIPNDHIRTTLEKLNLVGLDGELVAVGDNGRPLPYNETNSAVMSKHGKPQFKYIVFDLVTLNNLLMPFATRLNALVSLGLGDFEYLSTIRYYRVDNKEELIEMEKRYHNNGFEGLMIRHIGGPYKMGRSTAKEQWLLKMKRTADDEAVCIGFRELMHNDNAADTNPLGYTERATHLENMVPGNTLGSLIVHTKRWGEFTIGSGLDDFQRKMIWDARDEFMGRVLTFQYQNFGIKDKPRAPIFKGWRDEYRNLDEGQQELEYEA